MKSFAAVLVAFLALVASANGFSILGSSQFTGSAIIGSLQNAQSMSMEYIPSGMSKEQYRKFKEQEQKKNAGKNLGKVGITTFKSRSFADWQASGGKNLFPVDPTKVKNAKEIPYMQRPGGAADDSDLSGGNKGVGGLFNFGKKAAKKAPEPEPVKKSTNWWTL